MDFRIIGLALFTVFLAEFGDKTQLLVLSLSAKEGKLWSVFIGSAIALTITSLIAAWLGSILFKYLPVQWIRVGAGLFFILFGIITIIGARE